METDVLVGYVHSLSHPYNHTSGSPLHRENRENGPKRFPVRENTGTLDFFSKTQGILCAQVVNSLILKIKDIAIFAAIFVLKGNTGNLEMQFE